MKMKKLIPVVISLVLALIAACGHVTETGNPCPEGSCPLATPNVGEAAPYINVTYGVTITPPPDWTYEEISDSLVVFSSPTPDLSTAKVAFERLDPVPESLFAYLSETYPDLTFSHYSTTQLTGYMYDDPNVGDGYSREYFFLNNDVLVHVEADVHGLRLVEIGSLLNSIMFN